MTETTTRAVAYARYSSDNQRDASIDAQLREIKEYASKNNITIIQEYVDKALSGTTDKRPEFLKMIDDSMNKEFDVVLVHKLDRFSRKRYDSAIYKKKLSDHNVKVVSVLEPMLDGSPESILLESVVEGYADFYSANLKREVEKGMKENALNAMHNGGCPPLGYGVDPTTKKYFIIEDEAKIVRMIFDLYLNNYGYSEMINSLNTLGCKTKKGKNFGKNSIHGILKNEKYTGIYIFNRAASKGSNGKRNHHKSKDECEIIRIYDGMPAIIDKITFQKAQAMLERNKHRSGSYLAKNNYLLSGLVFCGICGHAMSGSTATGGRNKTSYSYYVCNQKANKKSCSNKNIRKEYLEDYVIHKIIKNMLSYKGINDLAIKMNQFQNEVDNSTALEIKALTKNLNKNISKKNNLVDIIAEGAKISSLLEKLKFLEEECATIERNLNILKEKNTEATIDKDILEDAINIFRNSYSKFSPQDLKSMMKNFVERIDVYDDKVTVVLKFL
ncbi:MAG TPA: recombinase family protein [Eubacteriaceae bacterium]|nr:recombinase family protein [Eubacteriaceae bacterium]